MDSKPPKRRTVIDNGETGEELVLATLLGSGDDHNLGPLVRHAFEMGRLELLVQQLKHLTEKKEVDIENLCKTHYEEFISAVDELRGVLVDVEELKSDLTSDNFRWQEFYLALKAVDLIEKNYLQNIPVNKFKIVIEKSHPYRNRTCRIGSPERKAEEMNMAGMDFAYQLDVDEVTEESVLKLDLTPLHRSYSYHIHTCLGLQEQFRDYYFKNRSLQLTSDLQIPFSQAFVESHQTYLAQIAGYFIVQDRILRTSRSLLLDEQV
ncbi:hypothetical protein GQ457_03G031370 [Hibiscus cannabinus]